MDDNARWLTSIHIHMCVNSWAILLSTFSSESVVFHVTARTFEIGSLIACRLTECAMFNGNGAYQFFFFLFLLVNYYNYSVHPLVVEVLAWPPLPVDSYS